MQKILLTLGACLLAGSLSLTASAKDPAKAAAKGDKTERKEAHAAFAKYDKNSNGVLDPDEREALRADFATDASLKPLDKNGDGKLDDSELDALKAGHKKKAK